MTSIADAVFRCQYETADHREQITRMIDTETRSVPLDRATHRDEAAMAAWSLWRSLVPHHEVLSVTVIGVDTRANGLWDARPLQYRYTDAELRALSPAGSDYAE